MSVGEDRLGAGRHAALVYARVEPDRVTGVRDLLGPTANTGHPEAVDVSRPSDAIAAGARV